MEESDAPENKAEIMRRGAAILAERLPAGWAARLVTTVPDRRMDGVIEVMAPDGASATFVVEAKRTVEGRDIEALREQLARYAGTLPNPRGLVAARYLSPPVRARLTEENLSYIDATGNLSIEMSSRVSSSQTAELTAIPGGVPAVPVGH